MKARHRKRSFKTIAIMENTYRADGKISAYKYVFYSKKYGRVTEKLIRKCYVGISQNSASTGRTVRVRELGKSLLFSKNGKRFRTVESFHHPQNVKMIK